MTKFKTTITINVKKLNKRDIKMIVERGLDKQGIVCESIVVKQIKRKG